MANPFDEVIEAEKKQETKVEPKTVIQESKPKKKEAVNISFSINMKWLERGIFVILILILAYFAFLSPNSTCEINDTESLGATTTTTQEEETKVTETKEIPKVEPKVEPKATTEEPKVEPQEKAFSTNFDMEIIEIDINRDDDGNPLSMNQMQITLTNRWKAFTPQLKVYWYDDKADDIMKNKVRLDKFLGKIEVKKKYTFTLNKGEFTSKYFYPEDKSETIKVELYEKETGILRKTVTQTIT